MGSGYSKPTGSSLEANTNAKLKELIAARAAEDAKWMRAWTSPPAPPSPSLALTHPVDPKPPSARRVAGPGSSSTTMTSDQGIKLLAASWQ